jgi:hypothetical protein
MENAKLVVVPVSVSENSSRRDSFLHRMTPVKLFQSKEEMEERAQKALSRHEKSMCERREKSLNSVRRVMEIALRTRSSIIQVLEDQKMHLESRCKGS